MGNINLKNNIGERLKIARNALNLTQKELCMRFGIKLSSYREYELCKRTPGGEAIADLMRAGINANWLLTGEGSVLLTDDVPSVDKPPPIDTQVLTYVIEEIESTLEKRNQTLNAARKAALIQIIYDYCIETGKGDAVTVEKFLKLVG